jgi:hypothetical protein
MNNPISRRHLVSVSLPEMATRAERGFARAFAPVRLAVHPSSVADGVAGDREAEAHRRALTIRAALGGPAPWNAEPGTCDVCGRHLLTGERVKVFQGAEGYLLLCPLCASGSSLVPVQVPVQAPRAVAESTASIAESSGAAADEMVAETVAPAGETISVVGAPAGETISVTGAPTDEAIAITGAPADEAIISSRAAGEEPLRAEVA